MSKKLMLVLLFFVPFIIGTVGYCLEGVALSDAVYGSFTLYAINPVMDEKNILVEFSRWAAPLTLAGGVLIAAKTLWVRVKNFFRGLSSSTVAVYSDNSFGEIIKQNISDSILTDSLTPRSRSAIIMYSDDTDALAFYEKNREHFKSKEVYMKLDTFNTYYTEHSGLHCFDPANIIAREFWRTNSLVDRLPDMKVRIAIVGFGGLGEQLLSCGLSANIYSLDQQIEYFIFGESKLYKSLHSGFETMNGDTVTFCEGDAREQMPLLTSMDRVILTDCSDLRLLSAVLELCTNSEIFCFSPDGSLDSGLFPYGKIQVFGNYKALLTRENIMTEALYRRAVELNHNYNVKYMPDKAADALTEWNALNGFTKMSNISSADYHRIRLLIMEKRGSYDITESDCELEHIRWCRFHLLNHWKYGETPDGKKDAKRLIHPLLIPYSELSDLDKAKDRETIEMLLELYRS